MVRVAVENMHGYFEHEDCAELLGIFSHKHNHVQKKLQYQKQSSVKSFFHHTNIKTLGRFSIK